MKFLRLILKILLCLLLAVGLFLAVSLSPNDHTPYQKSTFYTETTARLAALPRLPTPRRVFRVGWAKASLTPPFTTPTGGYGVRKGKHWTTVGDSIQVRAMVFDNGNGPIAIVAADLLILPPTVSEQLRRRLPNVGLTWETVYFGATHSHNSLGGWAPGLVGSLFSGPFDQRVVEHITTTILIALKRAKADLQPAELAFQLVEAPQFVYNRLEEANPVDPFFRLLRIKRADGKTATLATYAAHATLMDIFSYQYLSRDWPGQLVDGLERETGGFALFMAGAVGSMGPKGPLTGKDYPLIKHYARDMLIHLAPTLREVRYVTEAPLGGTPLGGIPLGMLTLPLTLRPPAPRVLGDWRIRPWLFHAVYGDYPSELRALRIGPALLIGTPCDFSGELVAPIQQLAEAQGVSLLLTSFNGGYIGYITPDAYYEKDAYETRIMNWFGPQNGAYFSELITGLVKKTGQ